VQRWAIAVAVAAGLACGGLPFAGALPLSRELEGEELAAAQALAEGVVDRRFTAEVTGAEPEGVAAACAAQGPAFVWLAVRDERADVREAAGVALTGCTSAGGLPVERGDAVSAARRLMSGEGPERAAGLALAGELLGGEEPGGPLRAEVLALLNTGPPAARYDALAALDRVEWGADPEVVTAVAGVLAAPEPWLVTEALRRARFRAAGIADPTAIALAARGLRSDIDPGIRGRAALLLVRLPTGDEAAGDGAAGDLPELVVGMLSDPHPYTRSAAAEALADLGYQPAIHDLVAHLDDESANTWDHLPFQRLDGTMVVQHHVGSLFERVDDAYLRALVRLTEPMGEAAFTYREVHLGKWRDLDIRAAGRDARRWYEEHGGSVPTH
jgi:hypothetical protein